MSAEENKTTTALAPDTRSPTLEWTALGGAVLVLLTAALFGIGRAYRAGYLSQLGVDPAQIPEDFHGFLYWGFHGGVPLLLFWMGAAVVALVGYAVVSWLLHLTAKRWKWPRELIDWWSRGPSKKPAPHVVMIAFSVLVGCAMYSVFLSYAATVQAFNHGIKRGRTELTKIESPTNDSRWIEIYFESPPSRVESGYHLLCTDRLCSIYDPTADQNQIRVVSLEGMREIRVMKERRGSAATQR